MAASARHEGAENGLVTKQSGWRCLALLVASGEERRRVGEGRLRCGMLRGGGAPFIGSGEGHRGSGNGRILHNFNVV
jgi:hypothetical protein